MHIFNSILLATDGVVAVALGIYWWTKRRGQFPPPLPSADTPISPSDSLPAEKATIQALASLTREVQQLKAQLAQLDTRAERDQSAPTSRAQHDIAPAKSASWPVSAVQLAENGMSIGEIAESLECSRAEVEFLLQLHSRQDQRVLSRKYAETV